MTTSKQAMRKPMQIFMPVESSLDDLHIFPPALLVAKIAFGNTDNLSAMRLRITVAHPMIAADDREFWREQRLMMNEPHSRAACTKTVRM